jgi:hypothetical protein
MIDRRTSSLQERVCKDTPPIGLPLVGDGLDQVSIGGAHADPEGKISFVIFAQGGQDKSGCCFADEGVGGNRTSAKGRTHSRIHGGESSCCESSRDELADGRHGGSDLEVYDCKFSVDCVILFLTLLGRATKPIYSSPLVTSLISVSP